MENHRILPYMRLIAMILAAQALWAANPVAEVRVAAKDFILAVEAGSAKIAMDHFAEEAFAKPFDRESCLLGKQDLTPNARRELLARYLRDIHAEDPITPPPMPVDTRLLNDAAADGFAVFARSKKTMTFVAPKGYPLLLSWQKKNGRWKITAVALFCI